MTNNVLTSSDRAYLEVYFLKVLIVHKPKLHHFKGNYNTSVLNLCDFINPFENSNIILFNSFLFYWFKVFTINSTRGIISKFDDIISWLVKYLTELISYIRELYTYNMCMNTIVIASMLNYKIFNNFLILLNSQYQALC